VQPDDGRSSVFDRSRGRRETVAKTETSAPFGVRDRPHGYGSGTNPTSPSNRYATSPGSSGMSHRSQNPDIFASFVCDAA
jgi:hypothetical protein